MLAQRVNRGRHGEPAVHEQVICLDAGAIAVRCSAALTVASFRRCQAQQRLSIDLRLSQSRFLALVDDSKAKSIGKQLAPSDQQIVSIRNPFKGL